MAVSFQRIAYEALDVCNGVEMAAVEAAVTRSGVKPGDQAVDVGTGNASVAIRLAQAFGLRVTAIEYDPVMAELAQARIQAAGVRDQVDLVVGSAAQVLNDTPPVDLITALGTTNLTGSGRPTPLEGFAFLRERLKPGGHLVFGDLVWRSEPSAPLRQIVEVTNLYTDDIGWRAAADNAGFELVAADISPQVVFDAYARDVLAAVEAWLSAHPDALEAASIRFNADRMRAIFDVGHGVIGFGLYLLRRPV